MNPEMRNLYRDAYSNLFDSVTVSDSKDALASCQANLTKMILSLKAPVLSLPQMFDSMPLLMLARKSGFQKLLSSGVLSTSLFGNFSSLKEYVKSRLLKEDYIFSCFPFLPQGSNPGKLTKETKEILLRKIDNNGKSIKSYSKELKKVEHFLDVFVEGINKLDYFLPKDNYRYNLPRTNAAPLSQQIGENLSILKKHKSLGRDPIIKKFDALVSRILSEKIDINDRTRYYNALNDCQDIDATEKKNLRELIDISYNQSMAPLIADTSRIVAEKKNTYAYVVIQEPPEENLFEQFLSMRLERVYDETQKDSILYDTSKKTITLTVLNEILETVEGYIRTTPNIDRGRVINNLYEKYYLKWGNDYALSADLDQLNRGFHISEVISENEQKGEKWLRKKENKNGEIEFIAEDVEIKKVVVNEGPNLDGDNTKRVAESTT